MEEFVVSTRGKGLYEVSSEVVSWVRSSGVDAGLLTLHVCHTSASVLIQENADPEVQRDFVRFFARLVPDGDPIFRHTEEGPDDMAAHIRSALTSTTVSIPVTGGTPALGTWQGLFLFEHRDAPKRRKLVAHLIGE